MRPAQREIASCIVYWLAFIIAIAATTNTTTTFNTVTTMRTTAFDWIRPSAIATTGVHTDFTTITGTSGIPTTSTCN